MSLCHYAFIVFIFIVSWPQLQVQRADNFIQWSRVANQRIKRFIHWKALPALGISTHFGHPTDEQLRTALDTLDTSIRSNYLQSVHLELFGFCVLCFISLQFYDNLHTRKSYFFFFLPGLRNEIMKIEFFIYALTGIKLSSFGFILTENSCSARGVRRLGILWLITFPKGRRRWGNISNKV